MGESKKEASSTGKVYRLADVSAHNTDADCWLAIHGKVYDVTKFLDDHPGGPEIVLEMAGQDSTEEFEDTGHSAAARKMLEDYVIGELHPDDLKKTSSSSKSSSSSDSGSGIFTYLLPALILMIAIYFKFFEKSQSE